MLVKIKSEVTNFSLVILAINIFYSELYILFFPIDERLIRMLYSHVERNVGKSLTLKILAKAQGIEKSAQPHPLFVSGGDQTISGVSM